KRQPKAVKRRECICASSVSLYTMRPNSSVKWTHSVRHLAQALAVTCIAAPFYPASAAVRPSISQQSNLASRETRNVLRAIFQHRRAILSRLRGPPPKRQRGFLPARARLLLRFSQTHLRVLSPQLQSNLQMACLTLVFRCRLTTRSRRPSLRYGALA